MSQHAKRRLLWLGLFLVAPVPILVFGDGWVPAAKLALLGAASLAVMVLESDRGVVPLLTLIMGGQALLYAGAWWLVARGVAGALTRWSPPAATGVALAVIPVGAGLGLGLDLYHDPFRAMPPAASTFPDARTEPIAGFDPVAGRPDPEPETDPALPFARTEWREPCDLHDPLRRPFFGDTHVHTAYSFDAWGQGTRNTPRDAWRFARGEAVGIQPYDADGRPLRTVQLRRPLDFALVSDHSEMLGEVRICQTPGLPGHGSFVCRIARRWPLLGYAVVNGQMMDEADPVRYGFCGEDGRHCRDVARIPWQQSQEAAEEAYDRTAACRFTSFVGFEWSGNPDGNMIHRNVLFRNADVPQELSNYVDDRTGEKLWAWLDGSCIGAPGRCDALAIPHNANLSGGKLFALETADGNPLTRDHAERRARLEPLLEVTQHKGDSECRAGGADELCDFETLPFARMREQATPWSRTPPPPMSYAREILVEGLVQQEKLGANPFKLGLVGATDTHLGTPGLASERDFPGHAAGVASARLEVPPLVDDVIFNPGGLQAVWAEENSRDALFAAMRRRETYGTSGPRMIVRLFAGFDLEDDLCQQPDFVARGYEAGVPMGGDLADAPAGAGLSLAVWAQRDPGTRDRPGTPLQRIQVIKLWVEDGEPKEEVIEIAGDPDNGAGVDTRTCEPSGPGFDELCTVWHDPAFDPDQPALYYARVVENPTCRWTAWACRERNVDCSDPGRVPDALAPCCDPEVPRTLQERAWTSPVWYTPDADELQP